MCPEKRNLKISIDQLRPGMFIVQLDIPWIESPFLKHARLIKNLDDLAKLREAGVKEVVIDLDKGLTPQNNLRDDNREPDVNKENAERNSKERTDIDNYSANAKKVEIDTPGEIPLEKEINRAYQIRNQIKNTLNKLNANLENNLAIDGKELLPLVDQTVESLERNNQALLNLVHLSRKSQKLVDHAFSTFCLSLNVGVALGLSQNDMHELGSAALLHDSGWLQLPLHLMGKRSPYTPTEKRLVESHVEIGLKILSKSNLSETVIRIVREHQELGDGGGYPAGLKANDILMLSKILGVVDHYDERVHQLSDKPGMLPNNALRLLYKEAEARQYDPEIVACLIHILGIYPVSTAVRLNTGEKAVVEQVYEHAHMEPVIRIYYDAEGRSLLVPLVVNLHSTEENPLGRKIKEVLDPKNPVHDPEHKLIPNFE